MRCEEVVERLPAFSAGELPRGVRRAVQAHLGECAGCREALGRVDVVAGVLAMTHTPPISSGFAARVMAATRQPYPGGPGTAWNPLRWWRLTSGPIRAAAAAVFLIGVAMGLVMGWSVTPTGGSAPSAVLGDPLDTYQLGFLSGAPEGSLANCYLTLVSAANGGGR